MLKMMVACAACNVGVVLYVSGMLLQAKGVFGVAGLFAMQALVAQMKLGKLIKKEAIKIHSIVMVLIYFPNFI